jgi:hypothetical protein
MPNVFYTTVPAFTTKWQPGMVNRELVDLIDPNVPQAAHDAVQRAIAR